MKKLSLDLLIAAGVFFLTVSTAQANWADPWLPRVTLSLQAGNNSYGEIDMLVPLRGNNQSLFFSDGRGHWQVQNEQGYSLGLGYRQLLNNQHVILGGYGFVDYVHSNFGHNFTQVNLGFESLSDTWDLRVNTYVPFSFREQISTLDGTGQFDGHKLKLYETVGTERLLPGAEVELGRRIPGLEKLSVYGDYYHYGVLADSPSINGARVRAEYKINPMLTLTASEQYDNYNQNQALVGIRINLGGISIVTDDSLADRMEDFIVRESKVIQQNKAGVTVYDPRDFYFVNQQSAAGGDGTYEHPFQREDEAVNAAGAGNKVIYTYSGGYDFVNQHLNLYDGQQLYGSNSPFMVDGITIIPQGEGTVFYGRINLANNTGLYHFTLDGSQVQLDARRNASPEANIGIYGDGLQNVELQGITVENFSGTAGKQGVPTQDGSDGGAAYGIVLTHSQRVLLDHVTVKNISGGDGGRGGESTSGATARNGGRGGDAAGVNLKSSVDVAINHLLVNAITGGSSVGGKSNDDVAGDGGRGGDATGLDLNGSRNTTIMDSVIADIIGGSSQGGQGFTAGYSFFPGNATGIDLSLASDAKITESMVTAITAGSSRGGDSLGSGRATGGDSNVTEGGNAYGIRALGSNAIALDRDVISLITGGLSQGGSGRAGGGNALRRPGTGVAIGIDLSDSQHSSVTNSTINFLKGGDTVGGVGIAAGGGFSDLAGDAIGISANNSSSVTLFHNHVSNLSGGFACGGDVKSPTAEGGRGGTGGLAIGIDERSANDLTVSDNVFSQLTGGLALAGSGGRTPSSKGMAGYAIDEYK